MNGATHIVDPDGDVMIVLRNANAPFAVSEPPYPTITEEPTTDLFAVYVHGGEPEQKPIEDFWFDPNKVNHNDHQEDHIDDESRGKTFRIQVSAKHLMLASRVFKASLTGGGNENITFCQQGSVEMTTEGWDLEAFLILLKIIHGQVHDLPRKLSLEMLAKVTVLSDFYECQKPVRVLANMMWIRSIMDKADVPNEYTRDIKLWLWISWFFQLEARFARATAIAMNKSKGLITPSGLPIPMRVIEDMKFRRERNIMNVLDKLNELLESFQSGDRGCSLLCSSVWLGFLTRKMHSNGLLSSQLRSPFPGWSYEGLLQTLEEFEEPFWLEQSCYRRSGECTDPDVMNFVHRFPS